MWRASTAFLGLVIVAYLQFRFLPGHSYLASSSQLYVPILEHLATPGYLSRDLVAVHPNVAFTAYDEITLALRATGRLDFRQALALQQFLCRLAGIFGIFLLARAAGLRIFSALAVASLLNLGAYLPGPNIWLFDPEPVPRTFALELILLAMGFLASEKPLLTGLSGGIALLYDPALTWPFWLVLLVAFLCDRRMRGLLRPIAPVFLIFVLLLANLAQLQPGAPETQQFLGRFDERVAAILQFRTPDLWISLWPRRFLYLYPALFVIGVWATTRIWPDLNRQLKWMAGLLPLIGILTIPLSAVLVGRYRSSAILRLEPMQLLTYTFFMAWLACALAAVRSLKSGTKFEPAVWSSICISVICLALGRPYFSGRSSTAEVSRMATWAEAGTWGSSMFLFPDAGRDLYPGVFRAQSRRALWADWESGRQVSGDQALALEWFERWQSTMRGPVSGERLQAMLSLPIDYYVFKKKHAVSAVVNDRSRHVPTAFSDDRFVVYEASALRTVPGTLTIETSAP